VRLREKVAIVTGGGSVGRGIGNGKATAILFAREGARVVVVDKRQEAADETVEMIRKQGGEAISVCAEVTKASQCQAVIETAIANYGRLDILDNNVGIMLGGSLMETTEEEWDDVITSNMKSVFLCSKAAVPEMMKGGGGSIINITSIGGMWGVTEVAYSASKAGLINLTKSMALELAPYNIRVNCIALGRIDTPMVAHTMPTEEARRAFERAIPLGRLGRPEDTAYAALFLASNESSFITGTTLVVDGGTMAEGGRRPRPRSK